MKPKKKKRSFHEIIHFNYCHHQLGLSPALFNWTFDIASKKHISEMK